MKKNREAKKAKKELESNNPINEHVTSTSIKIELTDDPEKNKKIKKITSVSISFNLKISNVFFLFLTLLII